MKPEEHTSPQGAASQWLVPVAWLLIAVVAPAALVWLAVPDRTQAVDGAGGGAQLQAEDLPAALRSAAVLAEHRAREQQWLESYGWIDRQGGIARMPIAEAMRAVLREGLPARAAAGEQRR